MTLHPATVSPSIRDLEWAAGFLDGEGSFGLTTLNRNGSRTPRVTCRQNEQELLMRLAALFGGNVRLVSTRANKWARTDFIGDWSISGPRARGVMMTLYSLLSSRRKTQIRSALAWKHASKTNEIEV